MNFFFALGLFLEISTVNWFWRGTDDSIIIFQNLPKFVALLDRSYDARQTPVVLGHCIDSKDEGVPFLQGGSGWVISRRAAELMDPLRDEFLRRIDSDDDVCLTWVLFRLGLSLMESTSEFFIGHDIKHWHAGVLWDGQNPLPACRPVVDLAPVRRCRMFLSPLHDLVFWHEQLAQEFDIEGTWGRAQRAVALPRNVLFWMQGSDVQLCRANREPPDPFASNRTLLTS
jgi:hypothetical protein